jgi:hypothetical protein
MDYDWKRARRIAVYHIMLGLMFLIPTLLGPFALLLNLDVYWPRGWYWLYVAPPIYGSMAVHNFLIAYGLRRKRPWAWRETALKDPRWYASRRSILSAIAITIIIVVSIIILFFSYAG